MSTHPTAYIGLMADCTIVPTPTFPLRQGRTYPSPSAVRAAAARWEARHPRQVLTEIRKVAR